MSKLFSKRRLARYITWISDFSKTWKKKLTSFLFSSKIRKSPTRISKWFSGIPRTRIGHMTIFFVFGLMILQPSRFQVETKSNITWNSVYAEVSEPSDSNDDGSVNFDMFIAWGNESGEIVYEVQEGDTLSNIAKNFGTTTKTILENNEIGDQNDLQTWQKIEIVNSWWDIIYEMESAMTVQEFAEQFDVDLDEIMELNYFQESDMELVVGQQLFLDLTREQAELKDLRQTPEYIRPAGLVEELPEDFLVKEDVQEGGSGNFVETILWTIAWWDTWGGTQILQELDKSNTAIENLIDNGEPTQRVISAADTTNQLEERERALIEAIQAEKDEEARKKLEAQKKALEAEIQVAKDKAAQLEKEQQAQQQVITAEQTTDSIEQANAPEPEVVIEQEVITAQETTKKIEQITSCGANKCLHKGKCRSIPEHAYCTPDDPKNAWVCEDGYVDTRRSCVEKTRYQEQTSTRWTEAAKSGTISQRYFNPYNDGYGNGRWAWHCTHYSGWYRWKHYGIMTNWRWNGWQRYRNASAAWRQVWSTPEVWAIFVADSGSGRWSAYGHVGIVIKVDRASNSILVEDMNYAGRYIVTQRWMSMNESGLIGYVYPRKK